MNAKQAYRWHACRVPTPWRTEGELVRTQGSSFPIVSRFNACIANADLAGLASLMTDDHMFVDPTGSVLRGKGVVLDAWRAFFAAFPGYRNEFSRHRELGVTVLVEGTSVASDSRLCGPFLWKAVLNAGLVVEWHVLHDTRANREAVGL